MTKSNKKVVTLRRTLEDGTVEEQIIEIPTKSSGTKVKKKTKVKEDDNRKKKKEQKVQSSGVSKSTIELKRPIS